MYTIGNGVWTLSDVLYDTKVEAQTELQRIQDGGSINVWQFMNDGRWQRAIRVADLEMTFCQLTLKELRVVEV